MGLDFVLAVSAPLQFHHRPFQFAVALALQQPLGQLPIGGRGQRRGDLVAGTLPLLVLQALNEIVLDRVAEIGFELETAQLFQQFGGQFGQLQAS